MVCTSKITIHHAYHWFRDFRYVQHLGSFPVKALKHESGAGMMFTFLPVQLYLVDSFEYAASALVSYLRSMSSLLSKLKLNAPPGCCFW